ncbi:MAG: hypothetical protein ACI8QF_003219 [Limisphaerales bacterium]
MGPDHGGLRNGAIPASSNGPFGGEIGGAARQLDDEGLHGRAASFHSDSIVEVELEGIRDNRHIAEVHSVNFDRKHRRVGNRFRESALDFKNAHRMKQRGRKIDFRFHDGQGLRDRGGNSPRDLSSALGSFVVAAGQAQAPPENSYEKLGSALIDSWLGLSKYSVALTGGR